MALLFFIYFEVINITVLFQFYEIHVFSHFYRNSKMKFGLSFNSLPLSPIFIDPEKEVFWKSWGKKRKCWQLAFSPFPAMFSSHPKKNLFCRLQLL